MILRPLEFVRIRVDGGARAGCRLCYKFKQWPQCRGIVCDNWPALSQFQKNMR